MKWVKAALAALAMSFPMPVWAGDLCGQQIQSVSIGISTATTTSIVAPQTIGGNNRRIIVCGYDFTVTGTTPTYQFEEGTGSTCGTGTVTLSGAYAPTAGTKASYGGAGSTILATDPGQRLCIVSGGTPGLQGILDYVIAP